jgi:GNAT superfamily N-acetyltransferase
VTSFRIEKLTKAHRLDGFDCGKEALNHFLVQFAWQNQQANAAQTYLGLADDDIIGFYSLVVGEVTYDNAPERLKKGLARHSVPLMLLARMGVHVAWQGRGVGKGLLRDAMLRTMQAADLAGIRTFAVHAKDEETREFYERFDFIPSPTDPMHLFLLIKDLRRIAE